MLVDSHCHIDTARFNADREAVISAAFEGGVTRIIDPGCNLASSEHALKLAKAHPGMILAGVGTHPHDATTHTEEVGARYREMAKEPEVVAIGEFGLQVQIKLGSLVEAIYVSTNANAHYENTIEALAQSAGIIAPVARSNITI